MKNTTAHIDQLFTALKQEKLSFDKNLDAYQQHLKAQLVSPAMLCVALVSGIILSQHIFSKTPTEETVDSPPSSTAGAHFFLRDIVVPAVIPMLTQWLMQKST